MHRLAELTKDLSELLASDARSRDAFIKLAVLGEAHRRLVSEPGQRAGPGELLQQRLSSRLHELVADPARDWSVDFEDLHDDLSELLQGLTEPSPDAIDTIDQLLHFAVACGRLALLTEGEVDALALRARVECERVATKVPALCNQAHRLLLEAGPRAGYEAAFSWLEPLAERSELRVAVASASRMFSPEKRAQIVSRVVERVMQARTAAVPAEVGKPAPAELGAVWERLRAALAPPVLAARDAAVVVRSFCQKALDAIELEAFRSFTRNLALIIVPGAGIPLTAASPQSLKEAFRYGNSIDIDVHLTWTAAGLNVTYQIDPPQPGALVLLLEDPSTGEPLATVAVPASVMTETSRSVATGALGFDPTTRPWQLRVMLA